MATPTTIRTALDLIEALQVPGGIDPRLARRVSFSLQLFLESGAPRPRVRVVRRVRRSRAGFLRDRRVCVSSQGADSGRSAV